MEEEKYGVRYATECEGKFACPSRFMPVPFCLSLIPVCDAVCKYFTLELTERLKETGKTHEVIETGYSFDDKNKKKKKYAKSELRLVESLDGICDRLLGYNIHKERSDSSRFAKGMSETFRTLHGLVDKGVKVDLGIPLDLWDKPSAEVTHLKTQCETMLEKYEDAIEKWYWNHEHEIPLHRYLCVDRALAKGDTGCLNEDPLKSDSHDEKKDDNQKSSPFHGNEL